MLVTSDIPLAAKAVGKHAHVLRPDGTVLNAQNIGNVLATRDLMADIRAADVFHQSKSTPFTKADKVQFSQQLHQFLAGKC